MKKGFVPSVCVVLLNAAYLYSFDSPTVFYVLNVLAHAGGGLLLTLALARVIRDRFRHWQLETRLAAVAGLLSGVSGAVLIYTGTSRPYLSLLRLHMLLSCLAVILFLVHLFRSYGSWIPVAVDPRQRTDVPSERSALDPATEARAMIPRPIPCPIPFNGYAGSAKTAHK